MMKKNPNVGLETSVFNLIERLNDDNTVLFTSTVNIDLESPFNKIRERFHQFNKTTFLLHISEKFDNNDLCNVSNNKLELSSKVIKSILFNDLHNKVEELKKSYDYVLILSDCAITNSAATLTLGISNGMVLLERLGKSKDKDIEYILENTNIIGKKVYGVILI